MDGLEPRQGRHINGRAQHRPVSHGVSTPPLAKKPRHSGENYWLVRTLGRTASKRKQKLWDQFKQTEFAKWPDKSRLNRIYAVTLLILFILSTMAAIVQPFLDASPYKLTPVSRSIIPQQSDHLAQMLKFNDKEAAFTYNEGYKPSSSPDALQKGGNGDPRFSAAFAKDPSKGMKVNDPLNNVEFNLTPKFRAGSGKSEKNQILYPLAKADGFLVYTAQVASVKEDIVLQTVGKDKMVFEYELGLADGLTAKLEENGSIGIYGSDLPLYGNVATGSEKDAELLKKAKENAPKTKFLFGIPAPYVKEAGKKDTVVSVKYELKGNKLSVIAENLKKATYPLTIDPSVYIQSAAQLMSGNNETNVEFDVATEQFKKGTTTGARIDEWTETGAMNDATYDQSVAAAGGYTYRAGGRSGRIMPWVASQKETSKSTASSNFTMDMPDVRPAGDLYVAIMCHNTATQMGTPLPAGWFKYADPFQDFAAFYHVGVANEPATVTFLGPNSQYAGVILRIKNADTNATNLSNSQKATGSSAGTGSPVSPSVTPNDQGSLVLSAAGFGGYSPPNAGYSPPSTNYADIASGSSDGAGGNGSCGFAVSALDIAQLSGVATGSPNFNITGHTGWGSSTISFNGITATDAYQSSLQWANFNSTTGSIDSPAPGSNGAACSGWCTNSAYNLPTTSPSATNGSGLVGMSLTAYNGYLYATGGYDGTFVKSTVYIAKLGANGEPSLWHPTDSVQANWTYWYKDTGLNGATARAYHSAYAYNGKMYIIGGDTNVTSYNAGALTTVEVADILPNGKLGTWSTGPALGTARYGASVQGYNGYLYVLGGNNNGTMITGSTASTSQAIYSKINSNGTLNSWQLAAVDGVTDLTAKASNGGQMSGIWGGYVYVAGGCTVVNTTANGLCTTIGTTVQLASINADGSLDDWNTMANIRNARFGSSFIAWQDNLYRFGGCSRQDTSSGNCYAAHLDIQYGSINQDGDASTVSVTQAAGSGNCLGTDPYDCNLPPVGDGAGQGGQMLSATAIMNGYLYVIGGCTTFDNSPTTDPDCTTGTAVSGNVSYVSIASDGTLKRPPSCNGSTYGAWCVDSTNSVNGTTGVAASGVAVFGGNIYVIGGLDGSSNVDSIYRNSTNADGSLAGAWGSQTFATAGVTTGVSYTFAYARANPSNATYPGNLYIFGGCGTSAGAGCSADYRSEVWKCNITTTGALEVADANDCDTAGQLQIDTEGGGGNQGLGIHAGTVYANYIYLIGGISPTVNDRKTVFYAKFDNSNNVVAVSGGAWTLSPVELQTGRRRGTAFGYNGYLYAVGGFEQTSSQVLDTIEFVKINVSDGSLVSTNNLFLQSAVTINQRWGLSLAVSNSYAYIIGGCNVGGSPAECSSFDPTVQTFQIYNNDSGAPGGYTTSANLYATDRLGASAAVHNGYLYIAGGCVSSTDCTDATDNVQFAPIDANGVVGGWANTTDSTLPGQRAYGQLEVAGGSLYYIGGQDDTSTNESADVYYATPSTSTGNIATWADATNDLPAARTHHSATVWNDRIYVTGGLDGSAAASTTIYTSPSLSAGGNIATAWTTTGMTAFNVARSGHVAISYANNLYILGGYTGSLYLSDVQVAKISSNGTVGSWTYSTSLPRPIRQGDGFASNGYMYIFGGRSSTNDCMARTLIAPISANTTIASGNNPTGVGEWYQTNRNFDGGRYGLTAVNYQGKAYVLGGGCQGIVMQDDFDATHTPGEWSNVTGMTAGTACQSISPTNTFSLTTGGATNQAATKAMDVSSGGTVYFKLYIPIADTGTCFKGETTTSLVTTTSDDAELQYCTGACGSWTRIGGVYALDAQDPLRSYAVTIPGTGNGNQAWSTTTKFRWIMPNGEANDSFAIEDVSVVATGNTTTSYATNTRVSQTALLSQPQIAHYSRLVDAGNDAFPRKFLINGLDNSIGARWKFKYRSMNDPVNTANPCGGSVMTGYGQETNFGDVTLGTPGTYTMKNAAGTDIGCGRYFFMTVSIDASQTYGYPDDISRGPTLDNLTLFFNSNPGKRLLHGKTFIEGIQQPLDTQP